MVSNPGNRWAVAGATFALWALVAASAVYWGMKLSSGAGTVPPAPPARTSPPSDPVAIGRLLGSSPAAAAAPALSSRFSLLGVVAENDGGGAALIAVDGKPPKPFRVGAKIDAGLVLQSVDARRATIGATMQSPPTLTLELPPKR